MKLFISYRSLDTVRVDVLVAQLRKFTSAQNTPRYHVWQDKASIPAGHDWWQAIVDAIVDCQVFVFMLSRESVQNVNCRAELNYARRRNRPIIPLVLENEYIFNPATGKNEITYWNHVPQELQDLRAQFLFYEASTFEQQFDAAVTGFEREPQRWRDIRADRPHDPRQSDDETNNTAALYNDACDYAWRLEFATAERLFQKLVNLNDPDFGDDAHEWMLLLREYDKLLTLDSRENTRYRIPARWEEYAKQFPRPFTPLFDPKNFRARFQTATSTATYTAVSSSAAQPMTAQDYFLRGYERGAKGNLDAAIADYTEALRLEPRFVSACNNRGVIYSKQGNFRAAIADFDQSIHLKGDDAEVWFDRGNAKYQLKNLNGAIADYTSAIRLNADYAGAYHNRAAAKESLLDYKGAVADYEAALRLVPGEIMLKTRLAQARQKANGK
jgi:tetratricopeptide (TPR) repeat protein